MNGMSEEELTHHKEEIIMGRKTMPGAGARCAKEVCHG
jgi:hypothetical protein